MKITVLIHRQTPKEPSEGTLKAYVVQSGKRGPNLLKGKQFTSVDSAIQEADSRIFEQFRHWAEAPEIQYEVEDYTQTK